MKRLSIIFALFLVGTVACGGEPDYKKLARLDSERTGVCLLAQGDFDYLTSITPGVTPVAKADSIRREWYEHQAKCEVATRRYADFRP